MDAVLNVASGSADAGVAQSRRWAGCAGVLPPIAIQEGRYVARFARSRSEVEAALRLRFEVFNLELGEGLESSYRTGLDHDEFDAGCHHLIVLEGPQQRVIGTYRLQTSEMAAAARGFYSANEFDLTPLPTAVVEGAVELGRACIDREHRNTQVLFLLWKGVAAYVAQNHKRYLFGCCSLTSQDSGDGRRAFSFLETNGFLHSDFRVFPKAGFECADLHSALMPPGSTTEDENAVILPLKRVQADVPAAIRKLPSNTSAARGLLPASRDCGPQEVVLPRLFRTYLRFGARVCGPPAIDRSFGTIDFFILFDVDRMDRKAHGMFFGA